MSLHTYNADYIPAMPVCVVYLGVGGEEPQLGPLEALIDTGANTFSNSVCIPLVMAQRAAYGATAEQWIFTQFPCV